MLHTAGSAPIWWEAVHLEREVAHLWSEADSQMPPHEPSHVALHRQEAAAVAGRVAEPLTLAGHASLTLTEQHLTNRQKRSGVSLVITIITELNKHPIPFSHIIVMLISFFISFQLPIYILHHITHRHNYFNEFTSKLLQEK